MTIKYKTIIFFNVGPFHFNVLLLTDMLHPESLIEVSETKGIHDHCHSLRHLLNVFVTSAAEFPH